MGALHAAPGAAGATGLVLVVDDDEVIRHLISLNLQLEGFEVCTAVDGEEALGKAVERRPVLVTLDVAMPGWDGFRTAEVLRRDPRTRDVKIVMVSAQEVDRTRGSAVGVDAYVTKPFDPADLVSVVRRLAG